ncbi:MAG: hypothetical protein WDN24_21995 [Sphingomonas sp.]
MRHFLFAAAMLIAAPALPATAQEAPAGTDVERVTLAPGESASFTLARGFDHQLLRRAAPGAKGAITVRYTVAGGQSTITATSGTGYATTFTVLADPDGNGGFNPAGEIALPGDGTPAARTWPGSLGTINVGDFTGGPHGDHDHKPSGE